MNAVLLALALTTASPSHVSQIAAYYFTLHQHQLEMKLILERDALFHFEFEGDCDFQKTTSLCVANYVTSNSVVRINGKQVEWQLGDAYTDNGLFIVHFAAPLESDTIERLSIQNQCFYEFDPNHRNRVILDLDPFRKSYLLTREKHSIDLKR